MKTVSVVSLGLGVVIVAGLGALYLEGKTFDERFAGLNGRALAPGVTLHTHTDGTGLFERVVAISLKEQGEPLVAWTGKARFGWGVTLKGDESIENAPLWTRLGLKDFKTDLTLKVDPTKALSATVSTPAFSYENGAVTCEVAPLTLVLTSPSLALTDLPGRFETPKVTCRVGLTQTAFSELKGDVNVMVGARRHVKKVTVDVPFKTLDVEQPSGLLSASLSSPRLGLNLTRQRDPKRFDVAWTLEGRRPSVDGDVVSDAFKMTASADSLPWTLFKTPLDRSHLLALLKPAFKVGGAGVTLSQARLTRGSDSSLFEGSLRYRPVDGGAPSWGQLNAQFNTESWTGLPKLNAALEDFSRTGLVQEEAPHVYRAVLEATDAGLTLNGLPLE